MKYRDRSSFMRLVLCALLCIAFGFLLSKLIYETSNSASNADTSISIDASNSTANNEMLSAMESSSSTFVSTNSVANNEVLGAMESSLSTFVSTLRSCIGPECFDQTVRQLDGSNIDRVGLLSPALAGAEEIQNLLMRLGKQNGNGRKARKPFIDLIYENHVPAYGYGKNHGWSRIIRLSRKIIPHAVALVANLNLNQSGFNKIDITGYNHEELLSKVFDGQIRQLVRWHCRLSHVAAHTKMLTVFIEDLLDRPAVELEKMLTFIGFNFARTTLLESIPDFLEEIKKSLAVGSVLPSIDNGDLRVNLSGNSKMFSTLVDSKGYSDPLRISEKIIQTGVSAMNSELKQTNGLTKWPCESFRNLQPVSNTKKDPKLDILLSTLFPSAMVAANCSSAFVTCSVPFDNAGG